MLQALVFASPQSLAVDYLDRLRSGIEILQQPGIDLNLELSGIGRFAALSQFGERDQVPQPQIAQW